MRAMTRTPASRTPSRKSSVAGYAAPTGGWVTSENIAATQTNSARIMDNWFPEAESVRLRRGLKRFATLDDDVKSMFTYRDGATVEMFAASTTAIYDITSPADADVTPTADVSSQNDGDWTTAQIGNAAGTTYLYAVNSHASDNPQLYDGTSWQEVTTSSSPIAMTGATLADLSFVWNFKSRLFFAVRNSLQFEYLAVDAVGGALTNFNLSAVFRRGGEIIAGGTWSSDSGAGFDDRCWILTSEGEVAVYEGTDPSSASTWALIAIYEVGKPLGPKAWMRVGGDVVFATELGMVPLSVASSTDRATLSNAAVSRPIESEWASEVSARTALDWYVQKWERSGMAVVAMPVDTSASSLPAQCFVVNLETGAWARYRGWNVRSATVMSGVMYVSVDARVFIAESTGLDDTALYTGKLQVQAKDLGQLGRIKSVNAIRATFLSNRKFRPALSCAVNYRESFPAAPDALTGAVGSAWDTAVFGSSTWGGSATYQETFYQSVSGVGISHSPQVQVTSGDVENPDIRLVAINAVYEMGGDVS